ADYLNRLTVMDRAMEGGINDVGLGVLFGLVDYRFEILAVMEHAAHLEKVFGCGPHTVSFPRIEPADGVEFTNHIPNPVSDFDFKKIIAIIRIAMPYTGIILSTRENDEMRKELIEYGVSQISAGSRTNPGAYSE
ncbi:MAG: [Bacteroidales bacterium]|nr:[FeFe] hydrogenase H-cluster radical SAM maturase HydG [Bacteroidales bacterium]